MTEEDLLSILKIETYGCRALPEKQGWPTLIQLLEKEGGTLFHSRPDEKQEIATCTYENGNKKGLIYLRFPTLHIDLRTNANMSHDSRYAGPGGVGSVYFIAEQRSLMLSQTVCYPGRSEILLEQVALGLLQTLVQLIPKLDPEYAYVTQNAYPDLPIPVESYRESGDPDVLCWANYYDKTLAEKVGRDFLLNAPGWQRVEMDNGGILYVTTPYYLLWHNLPNEEIIDYFSERFQYLEKL